MNAIKHWMLPVLMLLCAAGKLAVEGKDYVVQDGDIMHFRFNV